MGRWTGVAAREGCPGAADLARGVAFADGAEAALTAAGRASSGFEVVALRDGGLANAFGGWFLPMPGFAVGSRWQPQGEDRRADEALRLRTVE